MKTWQLLRENPDLWSRYLVKQEMIRAIRSHFESKNYRELESPIITDALPQERYLDVLTTNITQQGNAARTAYLVPTTERFNKIMLAAGIGNHFVITKVVRGTEQISPNHSPEFTMLEWYDLGASYLGLMDQTEELIRKVVSRIAEKLDLPNVNKHSMKIKYDHTEIDLSGKWYRFSVPDLLEKHAGIKLTEIQSSSDFAHRLLQAGLTNADEQDDWQVLFELCFAQLIEPKLPQDKPFFIFDYPRQLCPLTKVSDSNPLVCEKVELYIAGREIANGYTELLDWQEQEKRFKEEQQARRKLGMRDVAFDHDLVAALKSGVPPVAGIGMGLDRLAMILANAKGINEINLFPVNEWANATEPQ